MPRVVLGPDDDACSVGPEPDVSPALGDEFGDTVITSSSSPDIVKDGPEIFEPDHGMCVHVVIFARSYFLFTLEHFSISIMTTKCVSKLVLIFKIDLMG